MPGVANPEPPIDSPAKPEAGALESFNRSRTVLLYSSRVNRLSGKGGASSGDGGEVPGTPSGAPFVPGTLGAGATWSEARGPEEFAEHPPRDSVPPTSNPRIQRCRDGAGSHCMPVQCNLSRKLAYEQNCQACFCFRVAKSVRPSGPAPLAAAPPISSQGGRAPLPALERLEVRDEILELSATQG